MMAFSTGFSNGSIGIPLIGFGTIASVLAVKGMFSLPAAKSSFLAGESLILRLSMADAAY